jgi:hypothetical protein
MSRPGTTTTRSDTRATRSPRTGTGPWFIAGITGTVDADADPTKSVPSLAEYARRFGSRAQHVTAGSAIMFDEADLYFADGGAEVFVSPTADATDAVLDTALGKFTRDMGPGQVSAPGRVTATAHLLVDAHAALNNRIAINDAPDTNIVSTLIALSDPAGISVAQRRVSSVFAPFVDIPAAAAGGGARRVPPSGLVAAKMAQNDGRGVTPNQPAAGDFGVSDFATGVSQTFDDADRQTLNENGVNLIRAINGIVKVYGFRTLADPLTDENWLELSAARVFMAIQSEADTVAERFVFRQIDGQGKTISEFGGALTGVLLPYWQRGSLYGRTAGESFRVDVSSNVNTPETIADRQLNAKLYLKTSPNAEEVVLDINKVKITEAV